MAGKWSKAGVKHFSLLPLLRLYWFVCCLVCVSFLEEMAETGLGERSSTGMKRRVNLNQRGKNNEKDCLCVVQKLAKEEMTEWTIDKIRLGTSRNLKVRLGKVSRERYISECLQKRRRKRVICNIRSINQVIAVISVRV